MEHPGIDGCCHQVIGCGDGMNVTSQMKVELVQMEKRKNKQRESDQTQEKYTPIQ